MFIRPFSVFRAKRAKRVAAPTASDEPMTAEGDAPPLRSPPDADGADWDQIRRIGQGDRMAFERLYKDYYGYLFRFIYRVTRRVDLVEEIINEVMFVVWRKAATAEVKSRAATWIMGIAYNKSLKSLHGYYATASEVSFDEIEHDLPDEESAPINRLEVENLAAVAFEALPPDQRAVMELAYYQGMHYSEIAEVMGCPENTVKTRMFHARKKLRALLPALLKRTDSQQRG